MCFFIVAAVYYAFTDYIEGNVLKWNCGWVVIGLMIFNVFVNCVIIVMETIYQLSQVCKNRKLKRLE
jgi:hypothetical protein